MFSHMCRSRTILLPRPLVKFDGTEHITGLKLWLTMKLSSFLRLRFLSVSLAIQGVTGGRECPWKNLEGGPVREDLLGWVHRGGLVISKSWSYVWNVYLVQTPFRSTLIVH
jgi:hypothetical protein